MAHCLFCDMAAGKIPVQKVEESEDHLAFLDIHPQAPHHILIIPKKHIDSLNHLTADDAALTGRLILAASRIAESRGFAAAGYRVAVNCGADGGQTVSHLHFHLLAGRKLSWPPG